MYFEVRYRLPSPICSGWFSVAQNRLCRDNAANLYRTPTCTCSGLFTGGVPSADQFAGRVRATPTTFSFRTKNKRSCSAAVASRMGACYRYVEHKAIRNNTASGANGYCENRVHSKTATTYGEKAPKRGFIAMIYIHMSSLLLLPSDTI